MNKRTPSKRLTKRRRESIANALFRVMGSLDYRAMQLREAGEHVAADQCNRARNEAASAIRLLQSAE